MNRPQGQKTYIYGRNAVLEALRSPAKVVTSVYVSHELSDPELRQLLREKHLPAHPFDSNEARRMVGESALHQGVIATVDPDKLMVPFQDFLNGLTVTNQTALVVLGEVQDPHNVGAIIRSAAAFGLAGVLIPEHNQAQVTGTVVKTSAGMAFKIPLVAIGNVNETLRNLKDAGFWIYGLAMEGNTLSKEVFDAPAVFVLGSEGDGIREKTLETCDIPLSIPMHSRTESLNVSVSAGITFATWSTQHPEALQ